MIVVDDLHKSFGPVNALAGVSFTIDDGEIAALIGLNGAGKTTTLRTLCMVMKPSRGCVSVDGFDTVKNSRDVQMRIGVLPDTRGLYPRLTAREHVRYFGNPRRPRQRTRRQFARRPQPIGGFGLSPPGANSTRRADRANGDVGGAGTRLVRAAARQSGRAVGGNER